MTGGVTPELSMEGTVGSLIIVLSTLFMMLGRKWIGRKYLDQTEMKKKNGENYAMHFLYPCC
jgi:hypothetical protein